MRLQTSFIIALLISASISYSQTTLQASEKVIVDNGNTHAEMVTTDWGGSHGIFFGSKISYTGTGNLWENGNAVYSNNAGVFNFGAFSFGLIGNGGTFGFYDGGVSTGANNSITWDPVLTFIRGGNVGIGTPAPQHKLDINGNMRVVGGVFSGNVSIATTASFPDYKLAVGGNIIAEKVKVKLAANWPDYVFKPEHRLPTLKELESFIQLNKHLPGIPSAAEVEKDGLDLGDNQANLLKKIEELTLYAIEQDKRLEEFTGNEKKLQQQLSSQQQKLDQQQQELEVIKKQLQSLLRNQKKDR